MKKVITLSENELANDCHRLIGLIDNLESISAIVGIESGGAIVASEIQAILAHKGLRYPVLTVECRRPGTRYKNANRNFLRRLPYWVSDFLRLLESVLVGLNLIFTTSNSNKSRNVYFSGAWEKITPDNDDIILVVDDAVDSGNTLDAVTKAIKHKIPGCKIVTACITTTQKNTCFTPEYSLYKNILVRFHWASDYHERT